MNVLRNMVVTNDNFSDPEDFVDDISDSELLGDVTKSKYAECSVLVYGIPVVGDDRLEKLKKVLGKLFSIPSPVYKDYYPKDAENKTKGFCFVEYPAKECADAACNLIDGHIFDKNHVFSIYPLAALRKIEEPNANWTTPQKQQYADAGDLWWWLQNPKCLDQFAIQVENPIDGTASMAVYWNSRNSDPVIVNEKSIRENWSENIFKWSPYGTYLVTLHKCGVRLWGGEKFERIQRINHDNVNYIEFSPNETYLVTYSRDACSHDAENCLRIFDVFTGAVKRTFSPSGQHDGNRIHDWPFFKWSHDEKYFAFSRPKSNNINVYETENFTLYENKSIQMEGLISFEWNPTKNLIAYYVEERVNANAPAEFGIVEFPSRQKVRAQRIFSVSGASLFWQKSGSYLAVQTERYINTKKTKENEVKLTGITWHLEIFDCTEKDVSVQTIQLPNQFINFGWEHKGNKFCVLVGNASKCTPLVYRLDKDKPVPTLISKLESAVQLNTVEWAPNGSWLSVFAVNTNAGNVIFIDASGNEAIKTQIAEHSSHNQGFWDPTGRYFTVCSVGRKRHDGGYRIYTFQGRKLVHKKIESLLLLKWRPRPPVHIAEQKVKEIRRNLKAISQKFDEEDRKELLIVSKEKLEKRRKIVDEFAAIRNAARKLYEAERALRMELRAGVDTAQKGDDLVEENITIPLTTQIEVLKDEGADE